MPKMTNPLDEEQFSRLETAIEWSDRQLEFARKQRLEGIKEFVGMHHVEGGANKRVIVNFKKMAVTIHMRLLAPRAPRAMISTIYPELKPIAKNLELAVNQVPKEIRLQDTFQRAVLEALFSVGAVKCGLHTVGDILGHKYGEPFVDLVTIDDLIIDMAATDLDRIQYIGNEYWLNFEDVMESGVFPKHRLADLQYDEAQPRSDLGQERAESIAQPENPELFKEKKKLRDIWIPSEQILVTYAPTEHKVLNVIDWSTDQPRPYEILGFDPVPGNLLPLAPASVWHDLHVLANRLYRKLADQADSEKTVLGFQGDDVDGVEAFKNAKDGEGIAWHGTKPERLVAGGVNTNTLAFFEECKNIHSWVASGLDLLGGLSPMSETLGQDRLLSDASSAQLRSMAGCVVDFAKRIFESLVYYEWHDPIRERMLEKKIPGTDMSLVTQFGPAQKQGSLDVYDLDIDVYKLQDDSPALKLQKLGMIMQQYITPLLPAIEAAGGMVDVESIFTLLSKLSDFPELADIVRFVQEAMPPGRREQGMPANTTRTYERVNRPGVTEAGRSSILQNALTGGNPQQSEMAALGRQVG